MTNEQAQKYLKEGGCSCLECRSTDIEGGSVEIDAGSAHQDCYCLECGAEWTDSYGLLSVIDSDGNIFDKEAQS